MEKTIGHNRKNEKNAKIRCYLSDMSYLKKADTFQRWKLRNN